jgi:hypothetical protein
MTKKFMTDKKSFADRARDLIVADDAPHAHQAPDRSRWTDVLKHRWPTGAGIAAAVVFVVLSRVDGEDFLAKSILVMALIYLVWGRLVGRLGAVARCCSRSPG